MADAQLAEHDLEEVLAACFAAHRLNSGFVKMYQGWHKGHAGPAPNKIIVQRLLDSVGTPDKIGAEILEEDRKLAKEVKSIQPVLTMKMMSGEITGYEESIYSILGSKTVTKELGICASIPDFYNNWRTRYNRDLRIKQVNENTLTVGEKVNGVVEIIEQRFIHSVARYVYLGVYNDQLVSFWTGWSVQSSTIAITGKVKECKANYYVPEKTEAKLSFVRIKND